MLTVEGAADRSVEVAAMNNLTPDHPVLLAMTAANARIAVCCARCLFVGTGAAMLLLILS